MAAHTLITTVSRRSMLAGGSATLALPAVPLSAFAAMPVAAVAPSVDAELLRRIAEARRSLAAYYWAEAVCDRLSEAVDRHPDVPRPMPNPDSARDRWYAVADRLGFNAALARWERCFELYEAALGGASAVPARTLPGLHGKLRLAVTAVKRDQGAGFDDVNCTYLDDTLADLGRLAAG